MTEVNGTNETKMQLKVLYTITGAINAVITMINVKEMKNEFIWTFTFSFETFHTNYISVLI